MRRGCEGERSMLLPSKLDVIEAEGGCGRSRRCVRQMVRVCGTIGRLWRKSEEGMRIIYRVSRRQPEDISWSTCRICCTFGGLDREACVEGQEVVRQGVVGRMRAWRGVS